MGSYSGGKWKSLKEKVAEASAKKAGGPRTRGGARSSANKMEHISFRVESERQVKQGAAKKPVVKKTVAKATATKAVASPTMTRGSMPRSAVPARTASVSDVANKIEAPESSIASKRNISVGGLVGRTGDKWHLGKKVGKG